MIQIDDSIVENSPRDGASCDMTKLISVYNSSDLNACLYRLNAASMPDNFFDSGTKASFESVCSINCIHSFAAIILKGV